MYFEYQKCYLTNNCKKNREFMYENYYQQIGFPEEVSYFLQEKDKRRSNNICY